jgi:hypothetical protein
VEILPGRSALLRLLLCPALHPELPARLANFREVGQSLLHDNGDENPQISQITQIFYLLSAKSV